MPGVGGGATMGGWGDATAPVFRTAAGQRVSHDRASSDNNSTEKMLGHYVFL